MSHVYVLVEHDGDTLNEVTAELITAARRLGVVSAVVVGEPGNAAALASELGALGAEQVVDAFAADYNARLLTPEVSALHALASANPAPVVIARNLRGDEIAARLGARLASGVLANVADINDDGSAIHVLFGGTVETTAIAGGASPIYTLRAGAVKPEPVAASGALVQMELPAAGAREVRVTSFSPHEVGSRPNIDTAKTVVAGGRGVGSQEGFTEVVEPLADALGAAVGATRDATDEGWYPSSMQIGQTGHKISPDLYIGLGISGAIQHLAGMQTAGTIVVVNQDADEPFFKIADLGVVGDLHEVAPALAEELKARKSS